MQCLSRTDYLHLFTHSKVCLGDRQKDRDRELFCTLSPVSQERQTLRQRQRDRQQTERQRESYFVL